MPRTEEFVALPRAYGATKAYRRGTHRAVTPEETLARVASLFAKTGITRVANITGLDRVGIPVVAVCRPNSRSLSVSQGKGITLAAAKASGVMEALELYHAENISLPLAWGTRRDLSCGRTLVDTSRLMPARRSPFHDDYPILWVESRCLLQSHPVWVPFETVHTNACWPEPAGSGCFACTSNGLASGNHRLEAICHAIGEVVERDAVTLWRRNRSGPRLDLATVDDPGCDALLSQFERAGLGVLVWNVTSDVGIATFLCTVFERSLDPALAIFTSNGSGCHPDRCVALSRALTEAAQSRLTLIAGSRDDLEHAMYCEPRASGPMMAYFQAEFASRAGVPFYSIPHRDHAGFDEDVAWQLDRLRSAGFDRALCVDLSIPDFPVTVVRVLVPGLEGSDNVADYVPGPRARAAEASCDR
jgi:YcaO-like protein with predicted kinase domain